MNAKWLCAACLAATGCQSQDPAPCLREPFDSLDPGRWTPRAEAMGVSTDLQATEIAVHDGVLGFTPRPGNINLYLDGRDGFDLRGGFVEIELVSVVEQSNLIEEELVIAADASNRYLIKDAQSQFHLTHTVAGALTEDPTVPFDPTVRYVSASFDDAGMLVVSTSADRATWTRLFGPSAPGFAISALHVGFQIDAYNGGPPASVTAGFDNLLIASPSCDADGHDLGPRVP